MVSNPEVYNWLIKHQKNIDDAKIKASSFNEEILQRFYCIQSYFIRSSWVEKLAFLKKMFDQIKNKETMNIWFEVIRECCFDKISIYCELISFTHIPSDNIVIDNNRCLDSETTAMTKKADLEWFSNFDDDCQEAIFFSKL